MDGSTQTVMVDEHTRYRQGQQDIQLEDLKPGDQVFVRGQANSNKEFVAEAVRRVTADEMQRFQNAGERVFGAIVSIDKNQLKVSNPRQGERTVLVNDQTQFMKDGQPIALKDLKVGDRIFALGKETQGQFLATRVVTGQFRGPGQRRDNQ
jgi:3-dehydroquinate synthase class II